jgi:hypothetical protein
MLCIRASFITSFPQTCMKHLSALTNGWHMVCLLLLLTGLTSYAQRPTWQRAAEIPLSANGNNRPVTCGITATATDTSGNVYVAGSFSAAITVGSTTLTNGNYDAPGIFIAKWSPISNTYVWVQQATCNGLYSLVNGIAVNGTNIYITGHFSRTIHFGPISLTNTGDAAVFVAKLTDLGNSGSFVWAQQTSGIYAATAVAVNGTDVYITGCITGVLTGPNATFGNVVLTYSGPAYRNSGYVAKLTDQGTSGLFVWAKLLGTRADAIAISGTSLYVAGYFDGTNNFGSIVLPRRGAADAFIAKLTDTGSDGSFVWVQQVGSNTNAYAHAHAVAVRGPNVYIAGAFGGAAVNNQVQFGNITLTSLDRNNIYVAKLTDAGASASFGWAQQAGSTPQAGNIAQDSAVVLAVKGASVYVGGVFNSLQAHFGNTTLTNFRTGTTTTNRTSDCFLAKLTDSGNNASFEWAQQAGGPGNDYILDLAMYSGTLYAVGVINLPSSFGSINLSSSPSLSTGFLASLTDPTLLATTAATGSLSFSLAPNPARAATAVQLPAVPGAAMATLTLRDALGRTLRTATVALPAAGLRHQVDLSGLPAGIYAVQVQAGTTGGTQRLVVE